MVEFDCKKKGTCMNPVCITRELDWEAEEPKVNPDAEWYVCEHLHVLVRRLDDGG